MSNFFNIRRFLLLVRNDILSDYKSWLIYLITIVGIYTGVSLIEGLQFKFTGIHPNPDNLNYLFPGFLFLGGFIATSQVFGDINDKFRSSLWFSLPGSALEKYSVGVIIAGFGYVVFLILSFFTASVVSNIFTRPIFGMGLNIFNPFTLTFGDGVGISTWWLCLYYLLTHSIFLVGSISFKKAAFIKTVLVAFAVQLLYSVIFGFIGFVVNRAGIARSWNFDIVFDLFSFNFSNAKTIFFTSSILICLVISIFFNVVGYLKLREKEVKGGV